MYKFVKVAGSIAFAVSLGLVPAAAANAAVTVDAQVTASSSSVSSDADLEALLAKSALPDALKSKVRTAVGSLSAGFAARLVSLGLGDTEYRAMSENVIDPTAYTCGSTPLQDWLKSKIAGVKDPFTLFILDRFSATDLPALEALLFGAESKADSYGPSGIYTNGITSAFKAMKRFWDFDGSNIRLLPLTAGVYSSVDRMARVYETMGIPAEKARYNAQVVQAVLASDPVFDNGKNPLFTFNAFAFSPIGLPSNDPLSSRSPAIIMGDALLMGIDEIGLGDKGAAPRAVLAHEYGHQVQYNKGLTATTLTGPEQGRRLDMMADALGTYFTVHKKGLALNATRTLDAQKAFYNVGDCSFDDDSHHGTPNQRFNAAAWAVSVIKNAPNQGHQLGGSEFGARFDAKLPELVAPDVR